MAIQILVGSTATRIPDKWLLFFGQYTQMRLTDWLSYINTTCNANHSPERFCSLEYFYLLTGYEVRARTE
jgi:hypothetical protein